MLQQNGDRLIFTRPELHKLVHEKRTRDINDLKYLLNVLVSRPNAHDEKRRLLEELLLNDALKKEKVEE